QKALRELVEQMAQRDDLEPGSDEQKIGDFYKAFMDTERLEQLGLQPLKPYMDEIAAVKDRDDLVQLMADNDQRGGANPFGMFLSPDARDSQRYAVYVSQSGTSMPDRDYYLKDDERYQAIRQAFQKYVTDLLAAAEISDSEAIAKRILDLETRMAEVQWTRVENRDPIKTYNKLTKEEVAG